MVYTKAQIFLILVIFLKNTKTQPSDVVLCTAKTCSDYISTNPCPSISDECKIQNGTHNGLVLPSPDPCNCCTYCLTNLHEGDYCSVGSIGEPIPSSICGPELICQDGVCVKMASVAKKSSPYVCSYDQGQYDTRRGTGHVGFLELRPNCDADGFYLPYKCVPGQTCFCVDKKGNRIFGEIPYTSVADLILNCNCPRKYYDVLKFFDRDSLHPNEHFRCTSNGDYDTIQCIGDLCMCTDTSDGAPTFPLRGGVHMSDISNETLPECFNNKTHLTGKYFYTCAENYLKILDEVNSYKDKGYDEVFEVEFPSCDLDGTYAPVQKGVELNENNEEETYYYCAYPDGTPIDGYRTADNKNMDCKCARTNLLLPEDVTDRPQCCTNGNFDPVQCRRGKCYCVDADGYEVVTASTKILETSEDEKEKLPCFSKSKTCLAN